jgi:hypothetical protein
MTGGQAEIQDIQPYSEPSEIERADYNYDQSEYSDRNPKKYGSTDRPRYHTWN